MSKLTSDTVDRQTLEQEHGILYLVLGVVLDVFGGQIVIPYDKIEEADAERQISLRGERRENGTVAVVVFFSDEEE